MSVDIKVIACNLLVEKGGAKEPTFVSALKVALHDSGFLHINAQELVKTLVAEGKIIEVNYRLPMQSNIRTFLLPADARVFFQGRQVNYARV